MNKAGPIFGDEAMTDPVTIGTLAASALAITSGESVKGFVGEAVKEGYKKLKDKIARRAPMLRPLKQRRLSAAWQNIVADLDLRPTLLMVTKDTSRS
jgi:hypothetical protein